MNLYNYIRMIDRKRRVGVEVLFYNLCCYVNGMNRFFDDILIVMYNIWVIELVLIFTYVEFYWYE